MISQWNRTGRHKLNRKRAETKVGKETKKEKGAVRRGEWRREEEVGEKEGGVGMAEGKEEEEGFRKGRVREE